MTHPLRRVGRDGFQASLLTLLVAVVYAWGACPSIYVGDSGELVTAVHVLGIPHPTGYPLYVLLGKLWTLLVPFGSIAYRMSLFSVTCAALACGVSFRVGRLLGLSPRASWFAALLLAISPSLWGEANVPRVYALGALFVATSTAVALWSRQQGTRPTLAFFVCGLGATNHTFMAVHAVALGVWWMVCRSGEHASRRAILREFPSSVIAFAVGLLPYAYLPIRSAANPVLDWGNPERLANFMKVVSRYDYWGRAYLETPGDFLVILGDYLCSFVGEFSLVAALAMLLGLPIAWRRQRVAILLVLSMVGNLLQLALHGSRSDLFLWHRYYIPSYLMGSWLIGLGWDRFFSLLPRWARFVPLVLPAILFVERWPQFDRSEYRIAEDFSREVLRSLPPGAHLIATDDNVLFVLMYLHWVEQRRPDVDLVMQGVGERHAPPLHFDPDREPLFFTHNPNWDIAGLQIVPMGLVFQALPSDRDWPEPISRGRILEGEDDPHIPKDYLTQSLIGHFHFMLGTTYELRDWTRARKELALAAQASPENDVLFYNLGLIYRRNGLLDEAKTAFERARAINPRRLASSGHPLAADRLEEVVREQDRLANVEAPLLSTDAFRGVASGSARYHARLAELLEPLGEKVAARGHRLRAIADEGG